MPLIKLNRINKGGDIILNTAHIVFVEIEGKSTTVHLTSGLLFSVEESPDAILQLIETTEAARMQGGPAKPPG